MQLNQLKRKNPNETRKRVGRGGKRGKTSGRGTKGQKARAGHKIRPEVRDLIKKLPKLRGYAFKPFRTKPAIVSLTSLERVFSAGDTVTPVVLLERGLVSARKGERPAVKILGDGDITKKLSVKDCFVSGSAREKIEKAGGSIQ